jgi:hypothetical protein
MSINESSRAVMEQRVRCQENRDIGIERGERSMALLLIEQTPPHCRLRASLRRRGVFRRNRGARGDLWWSDLQGLSSICEL